MSPGLKEGGEVRSLVVPLYLPNLLFTTGEGAAIPMIALLALELGANVAWAGVIVALRGLGMMLFDLPAGALIARLGDRRAMAVSSAALALIAATVSLRVALPMYGALVATAGCAWSLWSVSRLSYATEMASVAYRGRVMSMVGGVSRIGLFLGPLLGGVAVVAFGLTGPFVLQAVLAGMASVSVLASRSRPGRTSESSTELTIREVVGDHRHTLRTAGLVVVAVQILRSSREAIIPLWGDSIGVSAGEISLIFGASWFMEMLVFYPVGKLMDSRGRKWALGPSMLLFSLGIAALPLSASTTWFVLIAIVIGFANGLGAGTNMTLGSDLSPTNGRSQFLGIWRFISDVGNTSGPLLVAGMTAVASLSVSAASLAVTGLAGLGVLMRWVPETLSKGGDRDR